jgi:hypothetical protein
LVAAMIRASTLNTSVPPTRSTSPVSIARSSLACESSDRSPTSSRNSVPVWAR